MLRDIHFLIIGCILLTLGLLGYFSNNPFLAFLALIVALVFFVRQIIKNHRVKPKEKPEDTNL